MTGDVTECGPYQIYGPVESARCEYDVGTRQGAGGESEGEQVPPARGSTTIHPFGGGREERRISRAGRGRVKTTWTRGASGVFPVSTVHGPLREPCPCLRRTRPPHVRTEGVTDLWSWWSGRRLRSCRRIRGTGLAEYYSWTPRLYRLWSFNPTFT